VKHWDDILKQTFKTLHLDTMRRKFVVFAVVATLVPTLVISLRAFGRDRRSVDERLQQELQSASAEAARLTAAWIAERIADLRLRANSYVVQDNLPQIPGRTSAQAQARLRDYLNSSRDRLIEHEGMAILGRDGQLVVASGNRVGIRLASERFKALRVGDVLNGDPYWDSAIDKPVILLAVPIRRADGQFIGAVTSKVNLLPLRDLLEQLAPDASRDVFVITEQGRLLIRARDNSAELMRETIPDAAATALSDREGEPVIYTRGDSQQVVAIWKRVPLLRWAAVAEMPRARAVRAAGVLRTGTLFMIIVMVAGVGGLAFVVGVFITRPLERLTEAAAQVAAGNLSTEFPTGTGGEIGYLSRAFNTVVSRLREKESHGELERLSLTDALTGLYNRRHLMGTLATEVQRSRRLRRSFSVLLADVDQFKQYNDTHGHLAGDAALVKIAEIFRKTTRAVDCVARYGGEEFVVMLVETTIVHAELVAERIRTRVEEEDFPEGRLTLSIGLAEYPEQGDTPEDLIASADAAMYEAKGSGRNQVRVAGGLAAALPDRPKEKKRRRKADA
jgi:diguanylate cyclase (GGDEF)-like protein